MKLEGMQITVLGGDDRELVLIPELIKMGAKVKVAGFSPCIELSEAQVTNSIEEAIIDTQAVIMPMPGVDAAGNIRAVYSAYDLKLTDKIVRQIPPYTPVLIGVARPFLKEWAVRYRLNLIEIADQDQVAVLNSIPSAEGALQIAMESLPITIHGSQAWVLGFGRVGKTLARMLKGLGAITTVCARKPEDLARIWEIGYQELAFEAMEGKISKADLIFNTVPAMVLDRTMLQNCKRSVLILDLASTPGGTDFEAAAALEIKAILAPGLPGKVAPQTAGKILAQVIPPLILEALKHKKEKESGKVPGTAG